MLTILPLILSPLVWTASAPASAPAGYEGQTQKVIERALQQYREAQSYRDRLVTSVDLDIEGETKPAPPPPQEMTLAFSRPNRIALRTPDYSIVSDGKTLWQDFAAIEQYAEKPAPEEIDLRALEIAKFPVYEKYNHPMAFVLTMAEATASDLLGQIVSYSGVKSEKRNGIDSAVVTGMVTTGQGSTVPFEAVFSAETGLLSEMIVDHTEVLRRRLQEMPGAKMKANRWAQHMRFEDVKLNDKIADSAFEFKPLQYADKVSEFTLPTQEQYQKKLVGRPAPDFATEDLDGRKVRLADFRGKTILLDFWATWCRPCLMSMPHVQQLAEKYADKPVVILGVNSDEPDNEAGGPDSGPATASAPGSQPAPRFERVKQALRRLRVSYPQIRDMGIGQDYRAIAIPYAVLIDKTGVVRAVHNGFSPDMTQLLSAEIDNLLRGDGAGSAPASATAPAGSSGTH